MGVSFFRIPTLSEVLTAGSSAVTKLLTVGKIVCGGSSVGLADGDCSFKIIKSDAASDGFFRHIYKTTYDVLEMDLGYLDEIILGPVLGTYYAKIKYHLTNTGTDFSVFGLYWGDLTHNNTAIREIGKRFQILYPIRDASNTGIAGTRIPYMVIGPYSPIDVRLDFTQPMLSTVDNKWTMASTYSSNDFEKWTTYSDSASIRVVWGKNYYRPDLVGALTCFGYWKASASATVNGEYVQFGLSNNGKTAYVWVITDPADATKCRFVSSDGVDVETSAAIDVNLFDNAYHTFSIIYWNNGGTWTCSLYIDATLVATNTTYVPAANIPLKLDLTVLGSAVPSTTTCNHKSLGILNGVRYYE